jgi:phosphomannomutase
MASALLRAEGHLPQLSAGCVPTPVATHAVLRRRAAGALVFTASHNAPEYHGLKVFGPWGGGIDGRDARWVEKRAAAELRRRGESRGDEPGETSPPGRADFLSPYRAALLGELDGRAIRRAGLRVVYDAMHGVGSGVLDGLLLRCGVQVTVLRGERDPLFGGTAPDPAPQRLRNLASAVRRERGLCLGLATDGDADRLAALDGCGRVLSETQTLALLVDHLARCGRIRRGVAISIATGSLVEKVAAAHGLPVERHPIGFRHLSRSLAARRVDAAGDESGGFALASVARDKDGILAGCLLAELVASSAAPLEHRLRELELRFGRSACARRALAATAARRRALARLAVSPPGRVGGAPVREIEVAGALRMRFDDGFLMIRASATEPVLRIYAEAPGPRRLARRLSSGERLLARSGGS